MQNIKTLFLKYPWLYLLLTNIVLAVIAWCAFVLALGFAIGESYHPDARSVPLFATFGVTFIVSIISVLVSLVWWFWRHSATPGRCALLVLVTVLALGAAGSIAYTLTEAKPDSRIYEYRGLVYDIPRVYSPSLYKDRLTVKVCAQDMSVGQYDYSLLKELQDQCESVEATIQPAEGASPFAGRPWMEDKLFSDEFGFTLATSSTGLQLQQKMDASLLLSNNIQDSSVEDSITLRSLIGTGDSGRSSYVFDIEADEGQVTWLVVCYSLACISYYPLPEDPAYVLTVPFENSEFYRSGELADGTYEEYREQATKFLEVFESFETGKINE